MEFVIIPLTAAFASLLTFFSGFGLGTLLLPAFALFYPLEVAVALTAVVHLLNNLFKGSLTAKHTRWDVVLRFGLPAVGGALLGSLLLKKLIGSGVLYTYALGQSVHQITVLKLVMAGLMVFFALFEIVPALKRLSFDKGLLVPGGFLSGFFGGLSGHQGALRSAFLIRLNLSKESFVATGVLIAILIDLTRMTVYSSRFSAEELRQNGAILGVAVGAAFLGAWAGNRILKKTTMAGVQTLVAILLFVMATLLGAGLI